MAQPDPTPQPKPGYRELTGPVAARHPPDQVQLLGQPVRRRVLRAHPRAAAADARPKRGLAERVGDDLGAYTELEDPACDLIVVAAEDWAAGRGGA